MVRTYASQQMAPNVRLESVPYAIGFYQSQGFVITADGSNPYGPVVADETLNALGFRTWNGTAAQRQRALDDLGARMGKAPGEDYTVHMGFDLHVQQAEPVTPAAGRRKRTAPARRG